MHGSLSDWAISVKGNSSNETEGKRIKIPLTDLFDSFGEAKNQEMR